MSHTIVSMCYRNIYLWLIEQFNHNNFKSLKTTLNVHINTRVRLGVNTLNDCFMSFDKSHYCHYHSQILSDYDTLLCFTIGLFLRKFYME